MFSLFVERFKAELKDRLKEKTNWGRNELIAVTDEVLAKVLAEIMDTQTLQSPTSPRDPQNPLPDFRYWYGRTKK